MPPRQAHELDSYLPETPYKDYLYTNFVPSDDECSRIRDLVGLATEELAKTTEGLEKTSDGSQDSLDSTARKRDQLQELIDSHLALVSGARRLPHDVLEEIFMACLAPNTYSSMKATQSPLVLSQICSGWRRSAISMCRLWASLSIQRNFRKFNATTSQHKRDVVGATMEKVTAWLTRSRNLPLAISFSTASHSIFRTILECSRRWEHIRFVVIPSHIALLARLSPADVPLLRTAVIKGLDESNLDSWSFLCAPNIRALSLRGFRFKSQVPLLTGTLVQLSLTSTSLAHALAALRQCPNLETCNLENISDGTVGVLSGTPIHLERMERLCVVGLNSTHLFHCIDMPNLRTLQYGGGSDLLLPTPTVWCTPDKVEEIGLSAEISTTALSGLLSEFPMLQNLLLHYPRKSLSTKTKSCKLFKVLTPQPKSAKEILCPHLQNICSLGFNVGSDEELLALIDARQTTKGIQPLSSVHIAFMRGRSADILLRLPPALTVDLRYPTRGEFREIRRGRGFQDPPELRRRRQACDVDWALISGGWLEWGRETEKRF
ncbi:hypothetical protein GGX14DRAFT_577858 [Mycena pura]|uniref:F-box domain-containing protein n=1 Tax=Mycena pura TaxID=153505 RepID=A0AAD6Y5S7_9AGAR|nr:hypothetical protein GGX14DRAFT_577858 [Mycena pura]